MTDRLTLAHAFEGAGIEREAAERVAGVVFDAIREQAATKADLRDAVQQLTLRGIGLLATGMGLLFAALQHWPPHQG